ncbi:uncharacterized protein DEA37_0004314 [Paragonimus westermani]|uniref:Uncharacterized protein n=1 Tax=Paragonimus westermani TaxID=34504 RepID=A0A5J4N9V3_9TREM|nr:uncharacterized protein DEA37_0004314 [Paragonimus westermani]
MQWNSLEQPISTGLLPVAVLVTFWDCVAGLFRLLVRSGLPEEQQRRSERSSTVTTKTTESIKGVNQPLLDFVSMFLIFQRWSNWPERLAIAKPLNSKLLCQTGLDFKLNTSGRVDSSLTDNSDKCYCIS